jgi:hypothetical protein
MLESRPDDPHNHTQWSASAAWNPNARDELISITHQKIQPKETEDRVDMTNQILTIADNDSEMVIMLKNAI